MCEGPKPQLHKQQINTYIHAGKGRGGHLIILHLLLRRLRPGGSETSFTSSPHSQVIILIYLPPVLQLDAPHHLATLAQTTSVASLSVPGLSNGLTASLCKSSVVTSRRGSGIFCFLFGFLGIIHGPSDAVYSRSASLSTSTHLCSANGWTSVGM